MLEPPLQVGRPHVPRSRERVKLRAVGHVMTVDGAARRRIVAQRVRISPPTPRARTACPRSHDTPTRPPRHGSRCPPPSRRTRSSARAMSATAKYGSDAVPPGPRGPARGSARHSPLPPSDGCGRPQRLQAGLASDDQGGVRAAGRPVTALSSGCGRPRPAGQRARRSSGAGVSWAPVETPACQGSSGASDHVARRPLLVFVHWDGGIAVERGCA
jgi:hypothetical protein